MELLLILGSGGVFIAVAWIVGFVRAVRRQPIDDRLKTYCQRR